MFQLNCGCGGPQYVQEYTIGNDFQLSNNFDVKLPNTTDKISCLKRKVINDYLDIIDKLECGIQSDIENVLQEISLITIKTIQDVHLTFESYFEIINN